ncbi:MAG: hypothetical protein JO053_02320 [Acidobacteria bacterium]|nr:hypothetical protein [Acidobacteriota bacterium]
MLKPFDMLTKIYLAVLAIATIVMGFFTFYASSWLKSIGLPSAAIDGYEYHMGLGWIALWFSTLVLLLLAAGILWSSQHAWALWAAFVFFAVFIVARSFWLEPAATLFKQQTGLAVPGFTGGSIMAAVSILGVAAFAFLAQFAIIRIHRKTYGSEPEAVESPDNKPESVDEAEK